MYPSLITFLSYVSRSIHYPECVYHTKYLSLYGYYGILCFKYFNIYKNVIQWYPGKYLIAFTREALQGGKKKKKT